MTFTTLEELIEDLCNTNDGASGYERAEIDPAVLDSGVASGVLAVSEDGGELIVALTDSYKSQLLGGAK